LIGQLLDALSAIGQDRLPSIDEAGEDVPSYGQDLDHLLFFRLTLAPYLTYL
jgi:hypothetical protein